MSSWWRKIVFQIDPNFAATNPQRGSWQKHAYFALGLSGPLRASWAKMIALSGVVSLRDVKGSWEKKMTPDTAPAKDSWPRQLYETNAFGGGGGSDTGIGWDDSDLLAWDDGDLMAWD